MSQQQRRKGIVFIVCGPSGTGKSTLLALLREEFPDFGFSVSYTTRAPRGRERDGVDYHFVDRPGFEAMREATAFCEWAEVHGNYYGTAVAPVIEMLDAGQDVLFDIDVQGARQLKKVFGDGEFAFLLPPSRAELVRRLTGRGTDAPEVIQKRLANAVAEMNEAIWFDHWVVNDDLDQAYAELRAVYLAARTKPALRPGLLQNILDSWEG